MAPIQGRVGEGSTEWVYRLKPAAQDLDERTGGNGVRKSSERASSGMAFPTVDTLQKVMAEVQGGRANLHCYALLGI